MFDEEDTLSGLENDTLTGGPTGSIDPVADEEDDTTGGATPTGGLSGNTDPVVDEGDNQETSTVVAYEEDSILNPEYVAKVKQSQFGELYDRLVSDEQESQCAEFLAPQLIKQDRLYNHTFNAAFGQFY